MMHRTLELSRRKSILDIRSRKFSFDSRFILYGSQYSQLSARPQQYGKPIEDIRPKKEVLSSRCIQTALWKFGLRRPLHQPFDHVHINPSSTIYTLTPARLFNTSNYNGVSAAIDQPDHSSVSSDAESEPLSEDPNIRVRQRLRLWETENTGSQVHKMDVARMRDSESVLNSTSLDDEASFVQTEDPSANDDVYFPIFEKDEITADLSNDRLLLRRGDLVELRSTSGVRAELAIFVRELQTQAQFYTMSGRWMQQRSAVIQFSLQNFVDPEEVDPLLPFLPAEDVPEEDQAKLQAFNNAPDRNFGAHLVQKMHRFWDDANAHYRASAAIFDNAHQAVAHKTETRYATLSEIAMKLIRLKQVGLGEDLEPAAPVLYAVHRALMQDEMGFRRIGDHPVWGIFAITSEVTLKAIDFVRREVRDYQEMLFDLGEDATQQDRTRLSRFISRAQVLIDENRKHRAVTPYGTIGPIYTALDESAHRTRKGRLENLRKKDEEFVEFFKSWVAFRTFPASSPLHGVGSTILRAIGRYEDYELDQLCGWVFLKEIGLVLPWETLATYEFGLPKPKVVSSENQDKVSGEMIQDPLNSIRKDWDDTPVYCIDGANAHEIDDGISIEPIPGSKEFWIHVHVADPASQISPESRLGREARMQTQTIYLPDRVVNMLPADIVHSKFSLAPDRPCLTFSAKLDGEGTILDHKVTAGILHNVIYFTPTTLGEILGTQEATLKKTVLSVGQVSDQVRPGRNLSQAADLSASDQKNLRQIFSLGLASLRRKAFGGAVFPSFVDLSVGASMAREAELPPDSPFLARAPIDTDPGIRMEMDAWNTDVESSSSLQKPVMSVMFLASEVAARWCHQRGVPIIYRVTYLSPDKAAPLDFFRQKVLPTMDASGTPSPAVAQEYLNLIRMVLPSTDAGPHLAIGAAMTTRCTSPLRRFSDLLTHWQIQATLLKEAEAGRSLTDGSVAGSLPFSKAQVDEMIPELYRNERRIKRGERSATREWLLQLLLRAWAFKQAPLPDTFDFVVSSVRTGPGVRRQDAVWGHLKSLGHLPAAMETPPGLAPEDIEAGDVFEVALEDINLYSRRVLVSGLDRSVPIKSKKDL